MFPGENGCFCCPDPPDPPPECVDCVVCAGVGPGDCVGTVCQNFVLEVENWANSATTDQDAGVCGGTGTGTMCGAYNGTFPLTRYDDDETPCSAIPYNIQSDACCEWRSESFTATTPTFTEINGKKCVVCEDVEVYYCMQFVTYSKTVGSQTFSTRAVFIQIRKAIDDMWIAIAQAPDSPDGINYGLSAPCSPEEFTEQGERLFYFLQWHIFGGQRFFSGTTLHNYFEGPESQGNSLKCGQPLYIDPQFFGPNPTGCTSHWEEYLEPPEADYPFWNCCKDSSWSDCDTMRDWTVNGLGSCPYGRMEWLPVRLTCAD